MLSARNPVRFVLPWFSALSAICNSVCWSERALRLKSLAHPLLRVFVSLPRGSFEAAVDLLFRLYVRLQNSLQRWGFAISLHGNSILICPKLLMIESFSIARLARRRLFASNWFPVLDSCSATVFCDWCGPKMRPMTHNGHFWATFTLQVTHTCSRL